jgi:dTMP kinase
MSIDAGGKFIVFEGCEGAGKTTQARILGKKLSDCGLNVYVTREPGGSEIAEKIRHLLKTVREIDAICEVLLMFAARRDHFVKKISPLLKDGYTVICDRFYDSSLVYQGILKSVPIDWIMQLKQMTIGDFEPDLTIILDLDIDIAIERVKSRCAPDEYDAMSRSHYEIIRRGFQKISETFPFRTTVVNANGAPKTVFSRIWKIIQRYFSSVDNFST